MIHQLNWRFVWLHHFVHCCLDFSVIYIFQGRTFSHDSLPLQLKILKTVLHVPPPPCPLILSNIIKLKLASTALQSKILFHRKKSRSGITGTLYKAYAMGDHFTRLLDDRINWTGMLNMVRRKNTDNILIYDIVCEAAAYMVDGALILLQSMIQSRRRAWHVNPRAGASYPPHLSYLTHRHHCPASYALFVGVRISTICFYQSCTR